MITCPSSSTISDQAVSRRIGGARPVPPARANDSETTTGTGSTLRSRVAAKIEAREQVRALLGLSGLPPRSSRRAPGGQQVTAVVTATSSTMLALGHHPAT